MCCDQYDAWVQVDDASAHAGPPHLLALRSVPTVALSRLLLRLAGGPYGGWAPEYGPGYGGISGTGAGQARRVLGLVSPATVAQPSRDVVISRRGC